MKVLIADDSAFMRQVLADIVSEASADIEVLQASNGVEALDLLMQHQPELLLLDLIMPEKSGLDVLREVGSSQNIIVISATGQPEYIAEAKQLGAKEFIEKPFEEADVKAAIAQFLPAS